ncbi:MAG: glycine betaine/L-proline ABC transporter ATP-binding protein [Alphaproteobacteria bacterium]
MSLVLESITKIFGPRPDKALERLEAGAAPKDLLAESGHVGALHNIDLTIEGGQNTVIMGLSGSGKSTLVRIINRLIEPTRGRVLLDDVDVTALSAQDLRVLRRDHIAMVFQHFALLPHRSVLDNAAYGLEIRGVPARSRRETACHWIETVGLAGYEHVLPRQLSGGMRQRVGLARALATDADILLMDEPFSALDPLIRREMQDLLLSLQKDLKKTLVFITHDLDEALRLGNRIALLEAGEVVQVGTPADLVLQPRPGYATTFVRDANRAKVLTAADLAQKAAPVVRDTDRPFGALREMTAAGVIAAYVIDRRGMPLGVVTAEAARAAADNTSTIIGHITTKVPVLPADMPLENIFRPLMMSPYALPVTSMDRKGPLLGVVSRDAVLRALADSSPT